MITQSKLKERLNYDPSTGIFTWISKTSQMSRITIGSVAGSLNNKGYWKIFVAGKTYSAHHLAWLYIYGKWPENYTDHINRSRADNRISNLREATYAQNQQNKQKSYYNTSGYKGVFWVPSCGNWRARIRLNGKRMSLGSFVTAEEAHAAYCAAANDLHGEFAHYG